MLPLLLKYLKVKRKGFLKSDLSRLVKGSNAQYNKLKGRMNMRPWQL